MFKIKMRCRNHKVLDLKCTLQFTENKLNSYFPVHNMGLYNKNAVAKDGKKEKEKMELLFPTILPY